MILGSSFPFRILYFFEGFKFQPGWCGYAWRESRTFSLSHFYSGFFSQTQHRNERIGNLYWLLVDTVPFQFHSFFPSLSLSEYLLVKKYHFREQVSVSNSVLLCRIQNLPRVVRVYSDIVAKILVLRARRRGSIAMRRLRKCAGCSLDTVPYQYHIIPPLFSANSSRDVHVATCEQHCQDFGSYLNTHET